MSHALIITIDGPAGSGKSTVAKRLAERLKVAYLDTGAMYRDLTLAALERGVPCTDEEALLRVATSVDLEIVFDEETKGNRVYLDGQDVTDLIRRPEVNAYVSLVSSHKKVRDFIVALQKEIARRGCIVMDGRDIGTVVMPDADWKIFLHASVEERARRRLRELRRNGHDVDLQELAEQIRQRDHFDSTRAISPLRKAEDAVEVDTTHLNIEEVVARVLAIIKGEA